LSYHHGLSEVVMKSRILLSVAILLCSVATVSAQQQGNIIHTPDGCVLGGELPMMMVTTADDGLLRAYFRRLGTIDWCSVDGHNLGKASNVIFPRFSVGTDLEYYFVVLKGKQVVAKSPVIYRTRALQRCDAPFARHAINLVMECLPPGQNSIATALNSGFHAQDTTPGKPRVQSPEKPDQSGGQ
jgi:hypothetical protein